MGKLSLIIKREYLAKVKNKSFIIMTFLSPVLMVGMVALVLYLAMLNGSDKRVITVLNESSFYTDDFGKMEDVSVVKLKNLTLEQAKDSTEQLGYYGLVYVPNASTLEEATKESYFYSKESPTDGFLNELEDIFQYRLKQKRLESLGVSEDQYAAISKNFSIHTATFQGKENLKGLNELNAIIGGGFGYLIMMFIIIYGSFVMRSVIEEKTSRVIEVIISSVKPFQLMMGKIIGTSLAGVTQFVIWVVSGSILFLVVFLIFDLDMEALENAGSGLPQAKAMNVASSGMEENIQQYAEMFLQIPWVSLFSFFLVYFILGYLIYSSIYAAIGAAVDNETDTQQFMLPVISPLMLAIYVGFISVFSNPHGPVAVGFSLFPLTSPIVMLMRLSSGVGEGGVPVWQLVVSIALLIVTFLSIVWLAAKIYRIGILMYGKKPSYKDLYKWLKY
ncbi:ABC transporter permease [Cellulophaga fucicola]|uniref:ABC-2 type transport system permease protein n=1 Tax=Cellulophaga fucicola TaxID=76595 RepID=A0A1K1QZV4_9FLAO|nr:ABC transporter permease [Cellulophaga fucicola]SFW65474.1 ABC-2 type transport system permease protein [Cellulophaga fucicola]